MPIEDIQKKISENIDNHLSRYATKNSEAIRSGHKPKQDIRLPFAIDRDRIIYSGAYRRLAGKTQVMYFSSLKDEQITNRITHIQYVSQIARSIGIALSLNLELLEAAALGHDLGHTPFGHDGEKFLSRECQKYGIGNFHHNIHSLYIIDRFSYHGKGMDLTFQVRDAIISHNGEIHESKVTPDRNKTEDDIKSYSKKMTETNFAKISPSTLEGCLIRVCDTISYIGSDIEDAIRLDLIKRGDIPLALSEKIGNNNGKIIDTLVRDIILNSYEKKYIGFSELISGALKQLKKFNYQFIYNNDKLKAEREKISRGFSILFEIYMEDLEKKNKNSDIFLHFLDSKKEIYTDSTTNSEKVRDFIASMTDRYFKSQLEKRLIPS